MRTVRIRTSPLRIVLALRTLGDLRRCSQTPGPYDAYPLAELAKQYGDQVNILKMDVDAHPNTPSQYGVRATLTILAFKGGTVVEQLQGARPKADRSPQYSGYSPWVPRGPTSKSFRSPSAAGPAATPGVACELSSRLRA